MFHSRITNSKLNNKKLVTLRVTNSMVKLFFRFRVTNSKLRNKKTNFQNEFELINRKKDFYKIFQLVIRSVTSSCVTPNLNSYIFLYFHKLLLKGSSSLRTAEEEQCYRCSTFLILFCTHSLPLKIRLEGFCISVEYLPTNKIY